MPFSINFFWPAPLKASPDVAYIEQNQYVSVTPQAGATQQNATWGLQPRGSTATELSAMLQQLGYQPEQQSQIRDIYGDVLFFALKQQYGREKATVLTAQALQEEVPAG